MIRLLSASLTVIAAIFVLNALAPEALGAPPPYTVRCDMGNGVASGTQGHMRVILGAVSVPRPRSQAASPDNDAGAWTHFAKAPLAVHAGSGPVTVSVPSAWRSRVAIIFGWAGKEVHALRVPRCGVVRGGDGPWDIYPGGST